MIHTIFSIILLVACATDPSRDANQPVQIDASGHIVETGIAGTPKKGRSKRLMRISASLVAQQPLIQAGTSYYIASVRYPGTCITAMTAATTCPSSGLSLALAPCSWPTSPGAPQNTNALWNFVSLGAPNMYALQPVPNSALCLMIGPVVGSSSSCSSNCIIGSSWPGGVGMLCGLDQGPNSVLTAGKGAAAWNVTCLGSGGGYTMQTQPGCQNNACLSASSTSSAVLTTAASGTCPYDAATNNNTAWLIVPVNQTQTSFSGQGTCSPSWTPAQTLKAEN